MSKEQSFTCKLNNIEVPFAAEFLGEDWETFDRFLSATDRLSETNFLKVQSGFTLSSNPESGEVEGDVTGPTNDDFAAYLHRLRPFQLNDESTSMNKIRGIIGKRVTNESIRKWLKNNGKKYRCEHTKVEYSAGPSPTDQTRINTEAKLVDWLNSYEYHVDVKLREELSQFFVAPDISRFFFVKMLKEKAKAIFEIANFIIELKEQRDQT